MLFHTITTLLIMYPLSWLLLWEPIYRTPHKHPRKKPAEITWNMIIAPWQVIGLLAIGIYTGHFSSKDS